MGNKNRIGDWPSISNAAQKKVYRSNFQFSNIKILLNRIDLRLLRVRLIEFLVYHVKSCCVTWLLFGLSALNVAQQLLKVTQFTPTNNKLSLSNTSVHVNEKHKLKVYFTNFQFQEYGI